MILALMADIHGNLPALRQALRISRERGAQALLVAGDLLGFYPMGEECLALLEEQAPTPCWMVAGNHDHKIIKEEDFTESYSASMAGRWQRRLLEQSSLAKIASLPLRQELELEGLRILLVHGSPAHPLDERVSPNQELPQVEWDLVILGHTHVPWARRQGGTLWLNPGSVGQPRDGDPRGAMSILHLPSLSHEPIRFTYQLGELEPAFSRMRQAMGLDDRLLEWLKLGRFPCKNKTQRISG